MPCDRLHHKSNETVYGRIGMSCEGEGDHCVVMEEVECTTEILTNQL